MRPRTAPFSRAGTGGLWFEISQPPVAQRPPRLKVLDLLFAKPTGYGLGKSGWVSATFEAKDRPPIEILKGWIRESYLAVAPKKLLAELE